jgi:fatty acid desaturase
MTLPHNVQSESESAEDLPYEMLSYDELEEFNKINSFKAIFAIFFQWFVIAVCIAASVYSKNWLVYIFSVIVIASRQQALGVVMHEAVHYHLFSNKKVGDLISQLFLAFPLGLSTTVYRHKHLAHHRFTNTENDPDYIQQKNSKEWVWPKNKKEAFVIFFRDLVGLNLHDSLKMFSYWSPVPALIGIEKDKSLKISTSEAILFFVFNVIAVGIILKLGIILEVVIYWYIPLITFLPFSSRVRASVEHNELKQAPGPLGVTRHTEAGLLERFLLSPCNINYHLAHHIYPSIPFYHLPDATKALLEKPGVKAHSDVTNGYFTKGGSVWKIVKA